MKGTSHLHAGDEPTAESVAADWLLRLDDPDLQEQDLQAWLEWFGASDTNRRAFDDLQTLRRRLGGMPEDRRQELKQRTLRASPRRAGDAFRERLGLPTAKASSRRRQAWAIAASIGTLALSFGWWTRHEQVTTTTYAAPADQHRTVSLDDGSSLVLDARSVVDVTFSRGQRSLRVQQGMAYFEVEPDPARPFVVAAAGVQVTAIGTAFSVLREADQVVVTVTHGRVQVARTDRTQHRAGRGGNPPPSAVATAAGASVDLSLSQGQRTVVALPTAADENSGSASASTQGWVNDRVEFIGTSLREVLPVVNRYAPERLVIVDPRVADLTFSGTIFRSHVDEWIASLPYVYPIKMVPLDNNTVTLVSRESAAP